MPEQLRDELVLSFYRVRQALGAGDGGDLDKTAYHAHSIKGAAANLGGLRLQQLAAEIESAARAGDDATVRARAQRLRHELELLTRELSSAGEGR